MALLAFAFACGKSESGGEEGGGPNHGGAGGAAGSAQSGGAGSAAGGASGSSFGIAGAPMAAGASATTGGASALGGGSAAGGAGALGGASAAGGEPSEPEAGAPSAGGAPGCSGSYQACGCGCCAGSASPASCVYTDLGQDLSTIVAADAATKQGATCATAGCNFGRDYFCCAAPQAVNDGATYQASLVISAIDRIRLNKMGTVCSTLSVEQAFSATPDPNAFPVQVPAGWKYELATSLPCTSSAIGPPAIGAIGKLSLRVQGTACLIDVHVTAFFKNDTLQVSSVRFDAEGVPLDIPISQCK